MGAESVHYPCPADAVRSHPKRRHQPFSPPYATQCEVCSRLEPVLECVSHHNPPQGSLDPHTGCNTRMLCTLCVPCHVLTQQAYEKCRCERLLVHVSLLNSLGPLSRQHLPMRTPAASAGIIAFSNPPAEPLLASSPVVNGYIDGNGLPVCQGPTAGASADGLLPSAHTGISACLPFFWCRPCCACWWDWPRPGSSRHRMAPTAVTHPSTQR